MRESQRKRGAPVELVDEIIAIVAQHKTGEYEDEYEGCPSSLEKDGVWNIADAVCLPPSLFDSTRFVSHHFPLALQLSTSSMWISPAWSAEWFVRSLRPCGPPRLDSYSPPTCGLSFPRR